MKDWVFALKAAIEKANARCRKPTGELPEVNTVSLKFFKFLYL
jgi:hypothetical protein